MTYPPYCINCHSKNINEKSKSQLCWNADFSGEDYGFDNVECVIGVYSCMHEDCGAIYEIMDFIFDDKNDERVIKYYRHNDDMTIDGVNEGMITKCLYCSSNLIEVPNDNKVENSDIGCEFISTHMHCNNCNIKYEVVDSVFSESYNMPTDCLDIYYTRTIFVEQFT